jgi:hypothetical protein
MGKNGKILTKELFKILDISLPVYKTRSGLKMIKIENVFYNIYDTKTINRIKDQMVIDKKYEMEYVFI